MWVLCLDLGRCATDDATRMRKTMKRCRLICIPFKWWCEFWLVCGLQEIRELDVKWLSSICFIYLKVFQFFYDFVRFFFVQIKSSSLCRIVFRWLSIFPTTIHSQCPTKLTSTTHHQQVRTFPSVLCNIWPREYVYCAYNFTHSNCCLHPRHNRNS